jgi:hypothetical protein
MIVGVSNGIAFWRGQSVEHKQLRSFKPKSSSDACSDTDAPPECLLHNLRDVCASPNEQAFPSWQASSKCLVDN